MYTEELADEIIDWISCGKTLRDFCRQEGKPGRRTIDDWRSEKPEFSARFARAREDGFDVIAEECLAIADTPQMGIVETDEDGGGDGGAAKRKTVREDMLGHRKLQVETRLKLLAKWDPRRYGDQPVKIDIAQTAEAIRAFIAAAREQDVAEGEVE